MFDFLKLDITNVPKDVLLNKLDFKGSHSHNTGEVFEEKLKAEYKSCKFIIHASGRIEFQGSLHKLWNEGVHNFDDFSFGVFLEMISFLEKEFSIDPSETYLRNVEFGVNIHPPIPTSKVIDSLLIHRGKRFESTYTFMSGNYKQANHNRYIIKIYDKQLQYNAQGLQQPTLRIEVKHKKMVDLNLKGIRTLEDLMKRESLIFFRKDLLKKLDELLLFDSEIKEIGKDLELKYAEWSNPNYWFELTKQQRCRERKNYEKVLNEDSDHLHKRLISLVNQKLDFLGVTF